MMEELKEGEGYPNWIDIPDSEDFRNMFGCVEMECAAKLIVMELAKNKIKEWSGEVDYYKFKEFDESTQKGLFMLAVHGWIADMETNGLFYMLPFFGWRITKALKFIPEERSIKNL
jgi:hypothetical protein